MSQEALATVVMPLIRLKVEDLAALKDMRNHDADPKAPQCHLDYKVRSRLYLAGLIHETKREPSKAEIAEYKARCHAFLAELKSAITAKPFNAEMVARVDAYRLTRNVPKAAKKWMLTKAAHELIKTGEAHVETPARCS